MQNWQSSRKLYKHYKHIRKIIGYTNALMYLFSFSRIIIDSIVSVMSRRRTSTLILTAQSIQQPWCTPESMHYRKRASLWIVFSRISYSQKKIVSQVHNSNLCPTPRWYVSLWCFYHPQVLPISSYWRLLLLLRFYQVSHSVSLPITDPQNIPWIYNWSSKYDLFSLSLISIAYKFRVHNYYFICSILPQIIYTLDLPTDLYSPTHLYTHAPLSKENEDIQRTLAKEAVPLVFDIVSNYPSTSLSASSSTNRQLLWGSKETTLWEWHPFDSHRHPESSCSYIFLTLMTP